MTGIPSGGYPDTVTLPQRPGFTKELLEAGQVVPVIDKQFPLAEVAEGMRWLENGRHRGKVVITVKARG